MKDEYSRWISNNGRINCPICDHWYDETGDFWIAKKYRYCPFCGNRLLPPKLPIDDYLGED